MVADQIIRLLEGRALNALPALEEEDYDGWILRAAGGYTGRANSAAPLDPGERDPAEKISYTEAWYRSRGLPPMIRLTPAAQPAGLDLLLEEREYSLRDEGVSVQAVKLDGSYSPVGPVEVVEGPIPRSWLAMLASLQPRVKQRFDAASDLFSRLPVSSAFAAVRRDGAPAAIGRAVLENDDVGLFDIATHPDLRRGGLATDITMALLNWGSRRGATRAYLQVEPRNDPALRLYRRFGFEEAYRYWYRVAPE